MRIFTNKKIVQKIVIAIVTVILLSFSVPKPVQADAGGMLMSPIVTLFTFFLDAGQHLLEKLMLGETSNFMRDVEDVNIAGNNGSEGSVGAHIKVEDKVDAAFFGLGKIRVPVIHYTPEEIFSNRVPALDINFISPSVKTDRPYADGKERNTAVILQPVISSWYVALRTLAVVGLLSVLVYLGIRMMLTSIAADKAKYKKMLMDWLVAVCLIFALHYIMSFALTMTETVTSMISADLGKTVVVEVPKDKWGGSQDLVFNSNLMSYVRFMVQCTDFYNKIVFFLLYMMLIIYSIRFTWVYLKRAINMAFLTLMAPLVALTYPIDKVSDGKAQAFNMWLKEFVFNALIQPLHLLLYVVLLGSAMELAVTNPLYAVVCLGFITSAEKIMKKMFGFEKASGGTLASLAGAAGITALTGKALQSFGKGGKDSGGSNKIRTDKNHERKGRDKDANHDVDSFNDPNVRGIPANTSEEEPTENERPNVPPPPEEGPSNLPAPEEGDAYDDFYNDLQNYDDESADREEDYNDAYFNQAAENNPAVDNSVLPDEAEETLRNLREPEPEPEPEPEIDPEESLLPQSRGSKIKRNLKLGGSMAAAAAGTLAYTGARKALRTAVGVSRGVARGALLGAAGLALGDGEQALSMAMGGAVSGYHSGTQSFDNTLGKVMKEKSIGTAMDKAKYGSKIAADNAKADKEYLKSEQFSEYYNENFKGEKNPMTNDTYKKAEVKKAFESYRQAGITDEDTIKKALKFEAKYKEKNGVSDELARQNTQNIIQRQSKINKKAYYDDALAKKEIQVIADKLKISDPKQKEANARQLFEGCKDFYFA